MKINEYTPEPDILREWGVRLAKIRKAQGYSQTELAAEAGIGVATLRRIEAGQDSQVATWLKLLKALNMAAAIDALLPESFRSPMAEALSRSPKHRKERRKKQRKQQHALSPVKWGDTAE